MLDLTQCIDHLIDLQLGVKPPFARMYRLSPLERQACVEY
jgi:hypothetical protein